MLWHPLVQLPSCFEILKLCPVDGCNGILNLHGWTSGSTTGTQPRILHDINHIVLLVGALYRCDGKISHTVYSTDPRQELLPKSILYGYHSFFYIVQGLHALLYNVL